MEGIITNSNELDIPKTETCKVLESDICEMLGHDGCSEMYNLEKNTDSTQKTDLESQEPFISVLNNIVPEEIPQNIYTEPNESPEMNKFIEPPVSVENPQFVDYSQMAKKVNMASNKRKSDNHIDSNIEEKKNYMMRKNIRGVINETNFDTITIAAQREESERLARVQGLKKSIKQKWSHSALEAMVDNIPFDVDLHDEKCLAACETPEVLQQNKISTLELKENNLQRLEEKRVDRKIWNRCVSLERSNSLSEEKDEVVTIDSSSDDDCIILSDSDDCLEDDDPDDDHHNSGLHVRDVLNIPNESGKVIVNVGHVDSEPDIFVAPQIAKIIKPHQIGGVRFLFDNIIESTKRFNNSSGFGCILAHSMGLGKTLQVVCFSDIFLRHTDSKTILCVMPINTIQNWVKEFNLWLPEESANHDEVRPRLFSVFALNDQHKTMSSRSNIILRWATQGGVLLIGYELFRVLGLKIVKKKEGKKSLENAEHKRLLDQIHMALVKPGPDLVICDEGHRIKNAHAGISIALKQIRSRRRIVLTGYPLQNNLLEYWCMVDFVRPNYLGSKTEFCNMFERPIQNGQCIDSTPEDIKLMRYRAHVLHSLLVGFVQRRSDSVLQNSLPQKLEYVILTKMTKFQRKLYEAFMNEVVRKKKVPNPLKAFAVCCKIWNHPDVLYKFLKKRESDLDLEIDEQCTAQEAATKANKTKVDPKTFPTDDVLHKEYLKTPDSKLVNEPFYSNPRDRTGFQANPLMCPTKESPNTFWQDGVTSVNAQPPKPDYVGMMAKSGSDASNGEKLKCSSEIVDLDTKEVQFIKSDINTDLDLGSIPSVSSAKPAKLDPEFHGSNNSTLKMGKPEVKTANESISYDWALNLIKDYEPGILSSSPKMEIFFYILTESIKLGDRVLVFSQSLLTLNLMELFLQSLNIPDSPNVWKKNVSYFRLDGSTSSLEREKLVNEFNSNSDIKLFLISTRAGSLGINLTGANRVVVFDASWNPCHDTQAVHRIYRYGQRKSCFVYRIVMDNCLEKNIYDRQVKKQGMSDRVVDECNPDAHLSIRELTNLCYDKVEENQSAEFNQPLENYSDVVMRQMITKYKSILTKEPFYHESLLIDRKEKKLSQIEKKLAKRGYEIEKKASTKPHVFLPNNVEYKTIQNRDCVFNRVNAQFPSFKNKTKEQFKSPAIKLTRWIPAEVWQRQGMSSQEMMLPIDVAIPTNSNETSNIVVKAGEKVMVLNSPKGVYMQLESGKIIAIKTSAVAAQAREKLKAQKIMCAEASDKKSIKTIDPSTFKEGICTARLEQRPCAESDKDDVIVINDSINDRAESSFDLTYPKHKSRTEIINPSKKDAIAQIFRNKKDLNSLNTDLRKDKQETLLLPPRQVFDQPPKAEPSSRANYVEKHRNNLFANMPNNSNYEILPPHNLNTQHLPPHNIENHQHLPSHSIENQHLPSHNIDNNQHLPPMSTNRWENKSPDMFKQAVKISNIPAPYPSTTVSDLNVYEKNEKPQQSVNDIINVEQYTSPYPQAQPQPCKEPEDHGFHHSMNLNSNYYNNSLPATSTDDNGSHNSLYHYNNKNECNYSDNLFENSDSTHSNYHQQMSKYSYGYYQPQYLPNFSNKVYDNNAFSSVSTQYYIRRPSTYSTSSTNGVDVGLNFTEPQGWIKKPLPD